MSVDLPLIVIYFYYVLLSDPASGLWVVLLTEFVPKVVTFLLWDVHDTFLLCFVPCEYVSKCSFWIFLSSSVPS